METAVSVASMRRRSASSAPARPSSRAPRSCPLRRECSAGGTARTPAALTRTAQPPSSRRTSSSPMTVCAVICSTARTWAGMCARFPFSRDSVPIVGWTTTALEPMSPALVPLSLTAQAIQPGDLHMGSMRVGFSDCSNHGPHTEWVGLRKKKILFCIKYKLLNDREPNIQSTRGKTSFTVVIKCCVK